MENYFNNKNLLDLVLKWKVHLFIIALIAGIASVVFSSSTFIKPKFKSSAIVYPVNLGEYSEESETEQMLELLNSGDIRDAIIDQFTLDVHYKIDKEYKYYLTAIHGKYAGNVSFRKTENEAVRIEVLDTDPVIAAEMVGGIIEAYHSKVRLMHNEKYQEELEVRVKEMKRQKVFIDSLVNRMSELGEEFGIIDVVAQAEGMFSGGSYAPNGQNMKAFMKNIGKYGPEFLKLGSMLEPFLESYNATYLKYNDAYRELNKEISYSSIVTPPFVADKKFWPKRSVIVLMSVVLTLLLALIVIGVIENRKYSQSR